MTDNSAAPAATKRQPSWALFAHTVCVAAQNEGEASVVDGIKTLGPEYSLAKDKGLDDSLSVIEIVMRLEEILEEKIGKPFKLPDQLEDKTENLGQAYLLTCRENNLKADPDFSVPPDISSFEGWLAEQAERKSA